MRAKQSEALYLMSSPVRFKGGPVCDESSTCGWTSVACTRSRICLQLVALLAARLAHIAPGSLLRHSMSAPSVDSPLPQGGH
jgi:hypothetical protein